MNSNKPTDTDYNSITPNNPPPTYEQVVKIMEGRKSQRLTILYILQKYGCISSKYMQEVLNYYSGSKRVSELKEQGHVIIKTQNWNQGGLATYWYKGKQKGSNLIGGSHG